MKKNPLFILGIIFTAVTLTLLGCQKETPALNFISEISGPKNYVVVISESTYAQRDWREVAETLEDKHDAAILLWKNSINEVAHELAVVMPKYTAFVMTPEEAGHINTVKISRMCRELDNDPYFDTFWGIVTGYDASDALRIAQFNTPITVERMVDATAQVDLNPFHKAISFDESFRGTVLVKESDTVAVRVKCDNDNTQRFLDAMKELNPQIIATSAHATQHDWDMGYKGPNMKLKHTADAKLYCENIQKDTFYLVNNEPKVYIGAGNCLIGDIDRKDCMATSWMRTGGAYQFIGYTVLTWFGEQGWGTLHKFVGTPRGFYTPNEAFHFANTDIIEDLRKNHPEILYANIDNYDVNQLGSVAFYTLKASKMTPEIQRKLGLLFDRDVVACYGDPAQIFRLPQQLKLDIKKVHEGQFEFTLSTLVDGKWPSSLYIPFPQSLQNPTFTTSGTDSYTILADNFIKLTPNGYCLTDSPIRFTITENRGKIDSAHLYYNTITTLADFFEQDPRFAPETPELKAALFRMKERLNVIQDALALCTQDVEKHCVLASIIFEPKELMTQYQSDFLAENAIYAYKAWNECPWKEKVSFDLFINYVLPLGCVNEERSAWRKLFYEKFAKDVFANCKTPAEAVQYLNQRAFKDLDVTYHATKRPKPCQSPRESIEAKFASCTGLSIILADALRACAVPSRFVGVALWTDRSGNHNWIEYWDDQWLFEGASPSDPRNRDWVGDKVKKFTNIKHWHTSVVAVARRPKPKSFIMVWKADDYSIPAININNLYTVELPNTEITLPGKDKVLWIDVEGEPFMRLTGEGKVSKYIPAPTYEARIYDANGECESTHQVTIKAP